MDGLQNGMLVRHDSLGVGKVVALEPTAVHVFFPGADRRFAAKLRLPFARSMLETEGLEPDPWLEGLTGFSLDAKAGRFALSSSWLTQEEAIEHFLAAFPGGFADEDYLLAPAEKGARASLFRAANEGFAAAFGGGQGEKLLAAGDLAALVKRAIALDEPLAAVHPLADRGAVKAALSGGDADATKELFAALFELLEVPSAGRARFERLFAAAARLPVDPARQWLVATLFPFVASPARHVLLRPKLTGDAAERLGCDLRDLSTPNWSSYAALRGLSTRLLETLAPHGATDFVDVEGFLHVVAAKKATKPAAAAAARKPRASAKRARPDPRSTT